MFFKSWERHRHIKGFVHIITVSCSVWEITFIEFWGQARFYRGQWHARGRCANANGQGGGSIFCAFRGMHCSWTNWALPKTRLPETIKVLLFENLPSQRGVSSTGSFPTPCWPLERRAKGKPIVQGHPNVSEINVQKGYFFFASLQKPQKHEFHFFASLKTSKNMNYFHFLQA